MPRNAPATERTVLCFGTVTSMKTGQFYAVRVEDLKPLRWQKLGEADHADELVYVVFPDTQNIIVADVRQCAQLQQDPRAERKSAQCVGVETLGRYNGVAQLADYRKQPRIPRKLLLDL